MFSLLENSYRIISIDETWLNNLNFFRRKYNWIKNPESIEEKIVSPRISIIGAIDTEGDIYLSLI